MNEISVVMRRVKEFTRIRYGKKERVKSHFTTQLWENYYAKDKKVGNDG